MKFYPFVANDMRLRSLEFLEFKTKFLVELIFHNNIRFFWLLCNFGFEKLEMSSFSKLPPANFTRTLSSPKLMLGKLSFVPPLK